MKDERSERGTVLVASHNESFRWSLIKSLFKLNYDVSEALDGNIACLMLEGSSNIQELILQDLDYRSFYVSYISHI